MVHEMCVGLHAAEYRKAQSFQSLNDGPDMCLYINLTEHLGSSVMVFWDGLWQWSGEHREGRSKKEGHGVGVGVGGWGGKVS